MKILFVPAHPMGAIAHGIPLLALSQKLNQEFISAFLVPDRFHTFFRKNGANVLDIPHSDLRTQMVAYHRFNPDVVVDDLSVTTAFARQLKHIPRITIQRTGLLPGTFRPNRQHSSDESLRTLPDVSAMGLTNPTKLTDLVESEAVIIPAIKSIERLPDNLSDSSKFYYSGPLLVGDCLTTPDGSQRDALQLIDKFLERHSSRQIILLTFGTIAEVPDSIPNSICRLLRQGIPVISTVPLQNVPIGCEQLFHFGKFLPFHQICARVSLVIHHCGSGTYQYPLIYGVPSVIVATGFYDRDDVAKQLHELGAATFLQNSGNMEEDEAALENVVQTYLNRCSPTFRSAQAVLSKLKLEMEQTVASFNFSDVLSKVRDSVRFGIAPTRR